ncbi:endo-1,4-beta-xylanase [Streptomyces sp. MK5]|uniref:endo-1,4-beta-xylanase n=1 Tax=Streptomyces sp. MK5 TaxID=3064253 RepID=UPI002741D931|nr:endo-1,4-beta-xylanase [Streptomyces sp. MK5]
MPFPLPPPRSRSSASAAEKPVRSLRGKRLVCTLAALVTAASGLLAAGTASPALAAGTSTLDQLAEAQGRYFGSATDNPELSDAPYTAVLGSEFGVITPGNSMKWDTTEPQQGQFNFSGGDKIVDFAQAHSQRVRGHTLVWHSQLPGWVSSLPAGQVQAAMENHITKEVSHYKGEIYAWDVVNEPFNDDGTFRADPFYNAMGEKYIADALRTAHAADPDAKLYINDYNTDGTGAKADAMYRLAGDLKSQGVPLDGIGFQGHLAIQYGFPTNMRQNLQRFADLGLDVAITELDVRMQLPSDATKLATQADYYRQVTEACLGVSRCVGITVWDFDDKYSWVPSTFQGQGAACLYDENLQPKPAYAAVRDALAPGVSDTTPPSAPAGLAVSGTTDTSASLKWSASTDDVGVTGYDIYRDGTKAGSSTSTSFTDTGLTPSTTYTYTVKAKDAAGNVSSASAAVTATTQAGGGTGTGAFKVQYKNNDTAPGDNQIKPGLQVVNTGTDPLDLSTVTLRYYFTGDGGPDTYSAWCDYAQIGCANVTRKVVAMSTPKAGADHYLEIGFTTGAGTLAAGRSTGDIQTRFNKSDWSNFDESDDYSRATNTAYADTTKVTAYVNGTLAVGTEP